jgi:hypothetical protein
MKPPQNHITVVLASEEIKAKFEELDMLTFLRDTCHIKNIPRSTKTRADRRYTAERGVVFIEKSDGDSQAILYWSNLLAGGEDYSVQQFTSPDGTFYSTDIITHPSNISG